MATGFGELWLQPSGSIGLMGAAASGAFVRGALDHAQVEPLFSQRHEYKNAPDTFLRTEFSEAHREATGRLAESAYEQVVLPWPAGGALPPSASRELMDAAPIAAAEAQEAGLVDHLGYRDAVREAVDRRWPEKPTLLYVSRYQRRWENVRRTVQRRRPAVGLIEAIGPIRLGRSKPGPVGRAAGSRHRCAAAFRAAVQDENIKAIVFRVNSPGGSYVASDTIWREVCRAREAAKPVVVSMGDVAGSGGYFVAMAADVIVAEPATLTGSIGVLRRQAPNKRPVRTPGREHRDARPRPTRAHVLLADRFQRGRVGQARRMARLRLRRLHRQGRPGTIHDAARQSTRWPGPGLDGGRRRPTRARRRARRDAPAVEIARERSGLPSDARLRPVLALSPVQRLRQPRNSDDPAAFLQARELGAQLTEWGGHAQLAASLGLPAAGPLTMPMGPLC